jgi:AraC-like DNA-binding protein
MEINLHSAGRQAPFATFPNSHVSAHHVRAEALRATRLSRIHGYIDAQLADPELSAHRAARALGMSVRTLHLTLSSTGETFGALVARRRLAACCAALRRPDNADTIADIAFAYGFNSLSSFYRAFRRVVGACPRDTGRAALKSAA